MSFPLVNSLDLPVICIGTTDVVIELSTCLDVNVIASPGKVGEAEGSLKGVDIRLGGRGGQAV